MGGGATSRARLEAISHPRAQPACLVGFMFVGEGGPREQCLKARLPGREDLPDLDLEPEGHA